MSVYVDCLQSCRRDRHWRWPEFCHLFSEPSCLGDLHDFAARLGLRRSWFNRDAAMPHYKLTKENRIRAIRLGAVVAPRKQTVKIMSDWLCNQVSTQCELELDLRESMHRPLPRFLTPEEVAAGFSRIRTLIKSV